jgi:hypothetical protein
VPCAVALTATAHAALKRSPPLLESVCGRELPLFALFTKFDEGVERFNFMLEILDDEFDHDRIVEVSESGNSIGNQIIRIGEIGEGVQDALTIRTFESPILVLEHPDQFAELPDTIPNIFGSVSSFDFFEQFFRFAKNDILVLGISALSDLPQNLSKITEILIAEFE